MPVDFVSALFDIDRYLKRYAGGLVDDRCGPEHIGSLAYAMMRVSASLFGGFGNTGDDKQM